MKPLAQDNTLSTLVLHKEDQFKEILSGAALAFGPFSLCHSPEFGSNVSGPVANPEQISLTLQ